MIFNDFHLQLPKLKVQNKGRSKDGGRIGRGDHFAANSWKDQLNAEQPSQNNF